MGRSASVPSVREGSSLLRVPRVGGMLLWRWTILLASWTVSAFGQHKYWRDMAIFEPAHWATFCTPCVTSQSVLLKGFELRTHYCQIRARSPPSHWTMLSMLRLASQAGGLRLYGLWLEDLLRTWCWGSLCTLLAVGVLPAMRGPLTIVAIFKPGLTTCLFSDL